MLLLQINQTTSNIFDLVMGTDQSMVVFENQIIFTVSGSEDLKIEYSINVPKKSGFGFVEGIQSFDDFLPIRLNYWFIEKLTYMKGYCLVKVTKKDYPKIFHSRRKSFNFLCKGLNSC